MHQHDPGAHCAQCGHIVDPLDQHLRCRWPDRLLPLLANMGEDDLWMDAADPESADFIVAREVGHFVRVLVPVRTDGEHITYGAWLSISEEVFEHLLQVWNAPEYSRVHLHGHLANSVRLDALDAPVQVEVLDARHTPYVIASTDDRLQQALHAARQGGVVGN